MMDQQGRVLRLRWRRTWADREDDYVASAPNYTGDVGRIYRASGGPGDGQWNWFMQALGPGIARSPDQSGMAASAREAAAEVERVWFRDTDNALHGEP